MGCPCKKNKQNQKASPSQQQQQTVKVAKVSHIVRPKTKPDQSGIWIKDNKTEVDVWLIQKSQPSPEVVQYQVLVFTKEKPGQLPVLKAQETVMAFKNKKPKFVK